ncbi:hypothetical protein PSAC2689_10233 [Paraburkholderia sacchari]
MLRHSVFSLCSLLPRYSYGGREDDFATCADRITINAQYKSIFQANRPDTTRFGLAATQAIKKRAVHCGTARPSFQYR